MNATATTATAKPAENRTRRLLVRLNTTLFYCFGAAVLLESATAAHAATRSDRADAARVQEKRERARWLREYAEALWPEFGWETACAAIAASPCMHFPSGQDAVTVAAIAARHSAMFYSALSCIADDGPLRDALEHIAAAERLRCSQMNSGPRGGPIASLKRLQFIRGQVHHLRHNVVRRTFDLLQQHWVDSAPFAALDYDAFLARARTLLLPHFRLEWQERVLYRGWMRRGEQRPVQSPRAVTEPRDGMMATRLPGPRHPGVAALPQTVTLR